MKKPVTLEQHIRSCQKLLSKHGNLELVYSIDDEGNGFQKIWWGPGIGYFSDRDSDFISEEYFEEESKGMERYGNADYKKVVLIN